MVLLKEKVRVDATILSSTHPIEAVEIQLTSKGFVFRLIKVVAHDLFDE
jgi:hypothetical protein